MIEDAELLRRYVRERSQEAFSELVRRRIDLVYSVALRHVGGDAHFAEDVTQKVFADLARKASTLLDRPVLSGWLYRSAQYAASDVVRAERRRRAREQETYAMQDLTSESTSATDWDRLRPWLDEVMRDLSEPDRDAVALRFFEGKAFGDIGRVLRLTEDAARKRVDRALDKMAAGLSKRGVSSTTAALGTVLLSQASIAAPAGLAASVAGTALAIAAGTGVATGAGVLALLGSGKVTMGAGIVAACAMGAAVYQGKVAKDRQHRLVVVAEQQAQLQSQTVELQRRLQATEVRAIAAEEDSGKLLEAIAGLRAVRPTTPGNALTPIPTDDSSLETGPITREVVDRRYQRGQDLARRGEKEAALAEFLWCYDRGMVVVGQFVGVRLSYLLAEIAQLGPPGIEALRQRRDAAERLFADTGVATAALDMAGLNQKLQEHGRTMALYDRLPEGDPRRRILGVPLFNEFIDAQRYRDAAAVRSFAQMNSQFESNIKPRTPPPQIRDASAYARSIRSYAVRTTAAFVEVLAGSGDVPRARELASRLLDYDRTLETRGIVEDRAKRAGHPNLLDGIVAPANRLPEGSSR